jgi:Domain of unknown function (DUF4258)
MAQNKLIFRAHALQRMFERSILIEEVREVVERGEIIKGYPDDKPYPSHLILGWSGGRPLHVVAADNSANGEMIIITAYEPDSQQWEADFKRRRT